MSAQQQEACSKLHKIVDCYYVFWCPGCEQSHAVPTKGYPRNIFWDWNGSMEYPTFNPSIRVRQPYHDGNKEIMKICHSFVKDGKIMFLIDSTHELAGKTVELPEWPGMY